MLAGLPHAGWVVGCAWSGFFIFPSASRTVFRQRLLLPLLHAARQCLVAAVCFLGSGNVAGCSSGVCGREWKCIQLMVELLRSRGRPAMPERVQ